MSVHPEDVKPTIRELAARTSPSFLVTQFPPPVPPARLALDQLDSGSGSGSVTVKLEEGEIKQEDVGEPTEQKEQQPKEKSKRSKAQNQKRFQRLKEKLNDPAYQEQRLAKHVAGGGDPADLKPKRKRRPKKNARSYRTTQEGLEDPPTRISVGHRPGPAQGSRGWNDGQARRRGCRRSERRRRR